MTDKIIVDIGTDDNGVAFIYNVKDGSVILRADENNNILDLLMMLPNNCQLDNREVDYSGDDEFDKWLDESSIGEM